MNVYMNDAILYLFYLTTKLSIKLSRVKISDIADLSQYYDYMCTKLLACFISDTVLLLSLICWYGITMLYLYRQDD